MRAGYTYGTVFEASVGSFDGHRYTAHVERHGYGGPSLYPPATSLRFRRLVVRWGADGGAVTGAGPLAPVAASRATLTVLDPGGLLAETVGSPDGAWRLRVERVTGDVALAPADGGPGTVWLGYLLQETYEDSPYAAYSETSLTFADGLGLLSSRPLYVSSFYRDLLTPLSLHVTDLGADQAPDLVTAVDWRPWLPATTLRDGDPLRSLYAGDRVWTDADGGTVSALDGLRQIAASLNARLYQSGGRWHLTQRGLLARTGGLDVPQYAYPVHAGPSAETSPTPAVDVAAGQLVRDTRAHPQAGPHGAPRRGVTLPVRSASGGYEVGDQLDDLLYNGSFEVGDPASNVDGNGDPTQADGWSRVGGSDDVSRFKMSANVIEGFSPATGDEWALRLRFSPFGTPEAKHDVSFALPGSTYWDLRLRAQVFSNIGESEPRAYSGGFRMRVTREDGTEVWAAGQSVKLRGTVLRGPGGRLYVDPLPGPVGQRVLAAGTVLHFWRGGANPTPDDDYAGSATVEEDAVGGATIVRADVAPAGDATAKLEAGDQTVVYYWATTERTMGVGWAPASLIGTATPANGGYEFWPVDLALTGVDEDGRPVGGALQVRVSGPVPPYAGSFLVDDMSLEFSVAGRTGDVLGTRLSLPAGAPGLDVDLGDSPFGDGPKADSATGLTAEGADGSYYPTVQGPETGWTEGAYAPGAPSTKRPLRSLRARDALRQLAGPLERVRTTYLLRGGAALAPEHVVRHWSLTALALPAVAGVTQIYTRAAPRAGRTVAVRTADGASEDYGVVSVTRGAGLSAVEIDRPLVASIPAGARVAYDVPCWWDAMEWDVAAGAVYYDATALDLAPDTGFLEEITLGT